MRISKKKKRRGGNKERRRRKTRGSRGRRRRMKRRKMAMRRKRQFGKLKRHTKEKEFGDGSSRKTRQGHKERRLELKNINGRNKEEN